MQVEQFSLGDMQSAPGRMVGGIIDSITSPALGGADLVTEATSTIHPTNSKRFSSAATKQQFPLLTRGPADASRQRHVINQMLDYSPPETFTDYVVAPEASLPIRPLSINYQYFWIAILIILFVYFWKVR